MSIIRTHPTVDSPKIQIQIPKRWWVMSIVRTNLADDGSQIWRWFADWQPSSFDRELDRKKSQKGKHPQKIYDLIPTSLLMQKIYKCHTNTLVLARTESTNTDIVSITQTHRCSDTDKKSLLHKYIDQNNNNISDGRFSLWTLEGWDEPKNSQSKIKSTNVKTRSGQPPKK